MRRGVKKSRVSRWARTNDEEVEKAALKELNETYYNEKEERLARYTAEHEAKLKRKEEERLNRAAESNNSSSNISAVLANEMSKEKELEDMKLKASRVQSFANQPD